MCVLETEPMLQQLPFSDLQLAVDFSCARFIGQSPPNKSAGDDRF
jgi:hypothetical protein